MILEDSFERELNPAWTVTKAGNSSVRVVDGVLQLTDHPTTDSRYSNAQISDYDYDDFEMRWEAPLRMTVTARASAPASGLIGTAGFGFWNHPLSPTRKRLIPRLPRAIWFFFAAPPANLHLLFGEPGSGWFASALDYSTPQAIAALPLMLPAALLMKLPPLERALWPLAKRAFSVSGTKLDGNLLAERHTYTIDWRKDAATFAVDGEVVHHTTRAPAGKVGFVAWIDNQYAVVTPQGHLRWGLTPLQGEQSLFLEHVRVERG